MAIDGKGKCRDEKGGDHGALDVDLDLVHVEFLAGRVETVGDLSGDRDEVRSGRARYGGEVRGFREEDVGDEVWRGRARYRGEVRGFRAEDVGDEGRRGRANDDDQGLRGRLKDQDDDCIGGQEGALGNEVHRGAYDYREGRRPAHDDGEGTPLPALDDGERLSLPAQDDGEERPLGGRARSVVDELLFGGRLRLEDDGEFRVRADDYGEGRRLRGPPHDGEEARVRRGRAYQDLLAPRGHAQEENEEEPRVRRDGAYQGVDQVVLAPRGHVPEEDEEEPLVRRGRAYEGLRGRQNGDVDPLLLDRRGRREYDGEVIPAVLDIVHDHAPLPGPFEEMRGDAIADRPVVSAAVAEARARKNAEGARAAKEAVRQWRYGNPNGGNNTSSPTCKKRKNPHMHKKELEKFCVEKYLTGMEDVDGDIRQLIGLFNQMIPLVKAAKEESLLAEDSSDLNREMKAATDQMRVLRQKINGKGGNAPNIPPQFLERFY